MTDADNVMNLQHFWNDPVDIRIRIQISRNLDSNRDHFWSRLDACLNDGCLCCLITVYRVRQSEMFQHEIRYYLRNAWIFLHQLFNVELYVASCCIYLMYAKLTETQLSRTNFATKGMARQALPRLHWQGLLAARQPRLNPHDYHVWRAMFCKFRELKPKRNRNDAADYLERSAWWNNSQICSELLQITHDMRQNSRRTFEHSINELRPHVPWVASSDGLSLWQPATS